MNEQQALAILRSVLDAAVKNGNIFSNMDEAFTASNAFNLIAQKFLNANTNADIKKDLSEN